MVTDAYTVYMSLESMCVYHFYNLFRMYILHMSESDFSIYHYISLFVLFFIHCVNYQQCLLYALCVYQFEMSFIH